MDHLHLLRNNFDAISSNMDDLFLINSSANVFVFGDIYVRHKDWLKYSGVTNRLGEVFYNFLISNKLTQMADYPTRVPDCDFLAFFHRTAYENCCAHWDGLHYHLRDVPRECFFKLDASVAATEFWGWIQVGIDIYVLIVNISPTHLHSFQLPVLLP